MVPPLTSAGTAASSEASTEGGTAGLLLCPAGKAIVLDMGNPSPIMTPFEVTGASRHTLTFLIIHPGTNIVKAIMKGM